MTSKTRWLVRLGVALGLVGAWFVLRSTLLAPEPVLVRVVAVERGPVEAAVTNTRAGTIEARVRAQLSPEISGRVVAVAFREGDRVEAGDVLVRLDDSSQRAGLTLAESALATAVARREESCVVARRAQREYERYRQMGEDLVSSDRLDALFSALEVAEATCATAAAMVAQAEAEVGLRATELEKTVMHAPFGGVLAEVSVEVGEFVTPAPPGVPIPSVIDLIDPDSIYVSAPMDEVDSAVIATGQPVRVTLDPFPDRAFEGRLRRVAPYVLDVEAQNRTVEIEVELEDRELATRLLPGTSADVEVILEVAEDALRIPTSALLEGRRVLVLQGGFLHERDVEIGLRNWDWTQITSGLELGERVVTSLGDVAVEAGAEAVARD